MRNDALSSPPGLPVTFLERGSLAERVAGLGGKCTQTWDACLVSPLLSCELGPDWLRSSALESKLVFDPVPTRRSLAVGLF